MLHALYSGTLLERAGMTGLGLWPRYGASEFAPTTTTAVLEEDRRIVKGGGRRRNDDEQEEIEDEDAVLLAIAAWTVDRA